MVAGELEPDEEHFAPAQSLLRSAPWVLVAIVVLFYEAAFIIGGSETRLSKPLGGLTDEELCRWTVPHNTAIESSWLAVVNSGRHANPINVSGLATGTTPRTWNTCDSAADCYAQVSNAEENPHPLCRSAAIRTTDFLVTFEPVVYSLFHQNPTWCSAMEVVEEDLFRFTVGWMYADLVANDTVTDAWASRREEIDVGIREARLNQIVSKTMAEAVGTQVPCLRGQQRVAAGQLLLPLLVALFSYYVMAIVLALAYPPLQRWLREENRSLAE